MCNVSFDGDAGRGGAIGDAEEARESVLDKREAGECDGAGAGWALS